MSHTFHFLIYYGSFLAFPFLIFISYLYYKKILRWLMVILFILSLLFIYARFIERYLLVVHTYDVTPLLAQERTNLIADTKKQPVYIHAETSNLKDTYSESIQPKNSQSQQREKKESLIKVAVFSDTHLGLYKGQNFLKKVVEEVNKQKPDFVLIPGDFTYDIAEKDLASMFAELKMIEAPVFAVTGNHDAESPGEYPSSVIRGAISPHDVQVIDNQEAVIEVKGQSIKIIGLSDLWEGKTEYALIEKIAPEENVILLTHNPDTAYKLPNLHADLMVTGHTHGGQIRIPFIYKSAIPTTYDFDQGFYSVNGFPVFVTSGVGEVGLPMRFLIPPEIAILSLQF